MIKIKSNYLLKIPVWVSEDLRDGNQSLISGLNIKEKLKIWNILINLGFKQIVLGFPSSNKHDFNFIIFLIKNNLIPKNIIISILTPAKKNLIIFSLNIIKKVKNVIIHLYNSISKNQRKYVFKFNKKKTLFFTFKNINFLSKNINKNHYFQYSPESFSNCELFFSKKISYYFSYLCYKKKIKSILNLPMTIENYFPNKYYKIIKFIKKNMINTILSIHVHNDMSNSISNSHLAIINGASRIEGTLLGNGERSGNSSLMIMIYNYYFIGINPKIKIINKKILNKYNFYLNFSFNKRCSWYSNLNYTAFSGSHQDAIFKSYFYKKRFFWNILYLTINPKIFYFNFKNIIKINSQSGRGGLKFIFWYNYRLYLNNFFINKLYNIIQNLSEILMVEIIKEKIISILLYRSINFNIIYNKIINFSISYIFNFKIIFFFLKKKSKNIIKNLIFYYE